MSLGIQTRFFTLNIVVLDRNVPKGLDNDIYY